ncbi:unnamed protein product [Phyllotreta striolata]|uniref:Uncharacterized protein n=1 Tax=Phyllotreta striolata TaxID=444603 RepID=A0A9N9TRJ0_PHYSR|nr:unnamed protein product [Phyllotreta striolata]
MNAWFKFLLFSLVLGLAKGAPFIRVVILAGLGLAGLWMVHTLAQDFSSIQNNGGINFNPSGGREIFKRSTQEADMPVIDWEMVLSRDPASCARSFLCQLVATEKELLTAEEKLMLKLVRYSAHEDTWASKQLQDALRKGEKVAKPSQCMKIYKFCPYTSQMMMVLLKLFGK